MTKKPRNPALAPRSSGGFKSYLSAVPVWKLALCVVALLIGAAALLAPADGPSDRDRCLSGFGAAYYLRAGVASEVDAGRAPASDLLRVEPYLREMVRFQVANGMTRSDIARCLYLPPDAVAAFYQ
jgi:hypothetical protein